MECNVETSNRVVFWITHVNQKDLSCSTTHMPCLLLLIKQKAW